MLKNIRIHYNFLEVESIVRLSRAYLIVDSNVFILEEASDDLWSLPISGTLKNSFVSANWIALYLKDSTDYTYAYNIMPFQPVISLTSEESIIEKDDLQTIQTIYYLNTELDRKQKKVIIKDFIRPPKYPEYEEKKILKELIFNFIERVKSIIKKTPKPDLEYLKTYDDKSELEEVPEIENLELPFMKNQIPQVFLQKIGRQIRILVRAVVQQGVCRIILNEDKIQTEIFKGEAYFWQKQLPLEELASVKQFKLEIEAGDYPGQYYVENQISEFIQSNLRRLKLSVSRADDYDWEEALDTSETLIDLSSLDEAVPENYKLVLAEEIDSKNTTIQELEKELKEKEKIAESLNNSELIIKELEEKLKQREIAIAEFENLLASAQNNNQSQEEDHAQQTTTEVATAEVTEEATEDETPVPTVSNDLQKAEIIITKAMVSLSDFGNSVVINYESSPQYKGSAILHVTDKLTEKARNTGSRLIFDQGQNTKKIWGRLMSKTPMRLSFPGATEAPVYELSLTKVSEKFANKEGGDYELDFHPLETNDEDDW